MKTKLSDMELPSGAPEQTWAVCYVGVQKCGDSREGGTLVLP